MQRRTALVGGIVALLSGLAPATAYAKAVPFDVAYQLGAQGAEAGSDQSEDSEFVGFCAKDACWGLRIVAGTSTVKATTNPGTLTLRGFLCVLDTSSACSSTGVPFTGVRITESIVDVPEGNADQGPVSVSFCTWNGATPATCTVPLPFNDLFSFEDTGNLTDVVPSEVGLNS